MITGKQVKTSVIIQSDDRSVGVNDGTPVIPIGSIGVVKSLSRDSLPKGAVLKSGCENSVVVEFDIDGVKHCYDCQPSEFTVID